MRQRQGFTLIELVIVMAIVAILAAVAFPAYQESVRKSRRSDAIAALLDIQLRQERYRANNPTYGTAAQIGVSSTSQDGYYTLAISNISNITFTVTATATAVQASDKACATLVLTQNGPDVGTDAKKKCWNKK